MVRRQGIGFSSEIEIAQGSLFLQPTNRRQGIGFSSEIEILPAPALPTTTVTSPGDWLLV